MKNSYKIRGTTPPFVLYFFFGFFSIFSSFSTANQCEDVFGSRFHAEEKARESARGDKQLQPNFFDIGRETDLVREWDKPPSTTPALLTALLPKDVHFINHQLYRPESSVVVKSEEIGAMVMARAHWSYKGNAFGSNVAFSKRALLDNLEREGKRNYLASSQAKAVIFYFHGGGTTTTGAHTANHMISHFARYGIDVVAVDLPWHGEGHRHFLNNFEMEIETLGAFVQKFIPPQVPLFVAGHSWGGVFAEKIMRMSDQPKENFSFHRNLSGAIIMSTAITYLPGKTSLKEVQAEYDKRTLEVLTNRVDEFPKDEMNIWTGMVMDGKISFLGGLYAKIMFQMSQEKPVHEGRDYIPALMIVGKNDPLVYVGFEKEYELYRDLKNVKTVYLDPLPTKSDPSKKDKTGHLLGDRLHKDSLDEGHKVFVHFAEMRQFIAEVLQWENLRINEPKDTNKNTKSKLQQQLDKIVSMTQEWANSLSFRQFLRQYKYKTRDQTHEQVQLRKQQQKITKDVQYLILPHTPKNKVDRILESLTNNINDLSASAHLYHILGSADFIKSIGNQEAAKDLVALYDQIKSAIESSSPEAITELQKKVVDFQSKHKVWLEATWTAKSQVHNMFSRLTYTSYKVHKEHEKSNQTSIHHILGDTDFIKSIEEPKVAESLQVLYDQIKSAIESSSPEAITELQKKVVDFQSKHKSWLRTPATIPKGLIDHVFTKKTAESAKQKLESSIIDLPVDVRQLVADLLNEHYKNAIILDKTYVHIPSKSEVNWNSMTPSAQSRAEQVLNRVSNAVQNQRQFLNEKLEIARSIKKLTSKHQGLKDKVKHHIKIVNEFLKKQPQTPLPSLKEEYAQLESQFESLQESAFQLEKIASTVFLHFETQQPMKKDAVSSLLTSEQQAHIQQFTHLFNQYIQNRAELLKRTIMAILAIKNDEISAMGDLSVNEVRAAWLSVKELYNTDSEGKGTKLRHGPLYRELEETAEELARAEIRLYQVERLIAEEQSVYNQAMNQWLNHTSSKNWFSSQAPLLFEIIEADIQRNVLSGRREHIHPERLHTDPEEMAKAIQLFREHGAVFQDVFGIWESSKSALPPPLPTEKQSL